MKNKKYIIQATKANQLIVEGLLQLSAQEVECSYTRSFSIMTKYGKLIVSLSTPEYSISMFTCFSRFVDVEKAKGTGCNPYSGKWNWHVTDNATPEYFAQLVLNDIKKIL